MWCHGGRQRPKVFVFESEHVSPLRFERGETNSNLTPLRFAVLKLVLPDDDCPVVPVLFGLGILMSPTRHSLHLLSWSGPSAGVRRRENITAYISVSMITNRFLRGRSHFSIPAARTTKLFGGAGSQTAPPSPAGAGVIAPFGNPKTFSAGRGWRDPRPAFARRTRYPTCAFTAGASWTAGRPPDTPGARRVASRVGELVSGSRDWLSR